MPRSKEFLNQKGHFCTYLEILNILTRTISKRDKLKLHIRKVHLLKANFILLLVIPFPNFSPFKLTEKFINLKLTTKIIGCNLIKLFTRSIHFTFLLFAAHMPIFYTGDFTTITQQTMMKCLNLIIHAESFL